MTEEAKTLYAEALNKFNHARKVYAAATIVYDNNIHSIRTKLYQEKLDGATLTAENIRSKSYDMCQELKRNYEYACAELDIAREHLEFVKATCNRIDF